MFDESDLTEPVIRVLTEKQLQQLKERKLVEESDFELTRQLFMSVEEKTDKSTQIKSNKIKNNKKENHTKIILDKQQNT